MVRVHFLGTGDAFGSGGRFHTCFFVDAGSFRFLIDCGATALIAMKRFGIDPESIDAIVCSHLHGDHMGGIPFLVRETQIARARSRPLHVAGPRGITERVQLAMEVLFPGSSEASAQTFPLHLTEFDALGPTRIGPLLLRAYPGIHTAGTHPHSLRLECGGKVITYSGDTEWTDGLLDATEGADLFIAEAYRFEPTKGHLDYTTLTRHRDAIDCQRIVLTHLGDDMIRRIPELEFPCPGDGDTLDLE